MDYLEEINYNQPDFGLIYDELPLWSAPFGQLLLEKVPIKKNASIVDIGTGTGFMAIELSQRFGSASKVYAVDLWQEAISRLAYKINFLNIKNVIPVCSDFVNINIVNESIDLVVSNLGINNFENPLAAFQTCFRILKNDGKIAFTTNLAGHMTEFYEIFLKTLADGGFNDQAEQLKKHINHRANLESISQLFADTGFEITDYFTDKMLMRFADGSAFLRHFFIRLGFLSSWKQIVPEDLLSIIFTKLENNLNELANKQGELKLTVPIAYFQAQKHIMPEKTA